MSKQTLPTTEYIDVCDWCNKRMDKYDVLDGKYHEPNKASIVSGYISHPTNEKHVNKFYFIWNRREERKLDVRYDFHTRCFDDMVKKALKVTS
jgi:hypothetical protein